ncbi:aldo/keto reductase [Aporhodopirellula aestuarii]|uniref:Aldo/keto reductase n=1 Tax=Aporhodopirellula aestuarii TaxID=2950107 RepID=A0ABT0TXP5_9BACT|nr:aldo/keto reductase [Aporhodopirellula aestuarii]MCM2369310.1 aldo/keto reductase [Aporhodopirellula aestuarii]
MNENDPSLADSPASGSTPSAPLFRGEVVLGLWPIAGVTTVGVTDRDADETIATAIELGVTTFDTAYSYGLSGESDRYLARAIHGDTDRFHIVSKVGQRYLDDGKRVVDSRPETLCADAEESLRRLGIERFNTLMLHSIDESVPIERSAEALLKLRERGLAERIGLCNASEAERARFDAVCDCRAIQCPLNLLEQGTLGTVIADSASQGCDVLVYWTLMKGLLAGKISPDHVFPPGDSRPGYAVFQGERRAAAHRVVDGLKEIASETGRTVANLSVSWTLSQAGVTGALVGARRPEQIREVAGAGPLEAETLTRINALVAS